MSGPIRKWPGFISLAGLVIFQAWAYTEKLALSLGPRVILQPWLIKRGLVLYQDLADLHTPLMALTLSALAPFFPDALQLARLVLVTLISLATLLTFSLGWRRAGGLAGLGAAVFFVAWSPTFGFGKLWHETFLGPLYLLLALIYQPSGATRSIKSSFFLGILGGIIVLFKQQGALVFLAFVGWEAFTQWHSRRPAVKIARQIGIIGGAASLPVLAYSAGQYLWAGNLNSFLYWIVGYQLTSNYKSLAAASPTLAQVGTIASSCLLLPAAVFCLVDAKRKGDKTWLTLGGLILMLVASSTTAYPRFAFFHLQASLPLLGVISLLTLAYALKSPGALRPFTVFLALALSGLWLITSGNAYRPVLRSGPPPKIWEYSDLVPLAKEIRQEIGTSGCVYVFPDDESSSNLYYLLGCSPPGLWFFHYPWYMTDWLRNQTLSTLTHARPEWVAFLPDRWDIASYAPEVFSYIEAHYQRETRVQWDQGDVWLLKRLP